MSSFLSFPPHSYPVILNSFPNKLYYYFYNIKKNKDTSKRMKTKPQTGRKPTAQYECATGFVSKIEEGPKPSDKKATD
jgi:hypothetical protein